MEEPEEVLRELRVHILAVRDQGLYGGRELPILLYERGRELEGLLAAYELIQRHPEGVDVRGLPRLAQGAPLLGRHIIRRPRAPQREPGVRAGRLAWVPRLRRLYLGAGLAQAKVGHAQRPVLHHQAVVGL